MPTKTIDVFGNRKLDARPDRLDLRDRPYTPPVVTLPPSSPDDSQIGEWLPKYVGQDLILDQKTEGSCTGFGLACVIHYLLWRQHTLLGGAGAITKVSTRMLYHLARFYDEWPGEDYEGSSCRGALKAWYHHGVCSEEIWPYLNKEGQNIFVPPEEGWEQDAMQRRLGVYYRIDHRSVVDMQAAIQEVGAAYVSANVHDGWNVRAPGEIRGHGSLPRIKPLSAPDSLGGHAFALVGYNLTGFVVQNSWGSSWGRKGFAVLPYDEWVRYGLDAWVCGLGVPADDRASSTVMVRGSRSGTAAGSPLPHALGHHSGAEISAAVRPWERDEACHHSIVLGNEGRPLNRIVARENGTDSVRHLVAHAPQEWLRQQPEGARRIVLYAHGGLNSEQDSLDRIKVLAPYFKANGVYPLFLTWQTGPIETLFHMFEDALVRLLQPQAGMRDSFKSLLERASEAKDRAIEVLAGRIAKPIWSQMKQNAEASVEDGRATVLVAEQLAALRSAVGNVELHLVGHSAGSILLGHFLGAARTHGLKVRSCSLYAPACTIAFANDHYRVAVNTEVVAKDDLHVHVLSDAREREDSVGPYGKSLLYLVSRALETAHKTPLLGLENVFSANGPPDHWNDARSIRNSLTTWRQWWPANNLHVVDKRQVSSGTKGRSFPAAHGCFDNHAGTVTTTLARILGEDLRYGIESLDY